MTPCCLPGILPSIRPGQKGSCVTWFFELSSIRLKVTSPSFRALHRRPEERIKWFPGIHPALVVAGEDGHHREPEEAVLQPAHGHEQDYCARRGRHATGRGEDHRPAARRHPNGREHARRRRRLVAGVSGYIFNEWRIRADGPKPPI